MSRACATISEIENHRINEVTDVLNEGDETTVKVIDIDATGRVYVFRGASCSRAPANVREDDSRDRRPPRGDRGESAETVAGAAIVAARGGRDGQRDRGP